MWKWSLSAFCVLQIHCPVVTFTGEPWEWWMGGFLIFVRPVLGYGWCTIAWCQRSLPRTGLHGLHGLHDLPSGNRTGSFHGAEPRLTLDLPLNCCEDVFFIPHVCFAVGSPLVRSPYDFIRLLTLEDWLELTEISKSPTIWLEWFLYYLIPYLVWIPLTPLKTTTESTVLPPSINSLIFLWKLRVSILSFQNPLSRKLLG